MYVVFVSKKYNEQNIALKNVSPDTLVLIVDMDRCIGCGACRLACQTEHGEQPTSPCRRIDIGGHGNAPAKYLALPTSCEVCAAPCDYQHIGYWAFCPDGYTKAYTGATCDHCDSRVQKGLVPVCATRCSMKCLHVGRAADISFVLEEKRLRNMGEAVFGE